METSLSQRVEVAARRHSARRFAALLDADRPAPLDVTDPGVIASPIPWVVVDVARSAGRPVPLRYRGETASGWASAPLAPPPRDLRRRARGLATAEDAQGGTHVVAWADRDAPRVHLLVDPEALQRVSDTDPDPSPAVADVLFGEPLDAVLEADGPPRVGAEVRARLATLLRATSKGRREAARQELEMVRRFLGQEPVADRIARHLQELEAIVADERLESGPDDAHVAREAERLTQLVADRAVGALCVGHDHLVGFVSPRTKDGRSWLRPLTFRLTPSCTWGASLRIWDALRPGKQGFAPCLGEALPVLSRLAREHDAYGLVDTVLNFVETNQLGWARLAARARVPDGRLRDVLDLPF